MISIEREGLRVPENEAYPREGGTTFTNTSSPSKTSSARLKWLNSENYKASLYKRRWMRI
jgi:hypothetical protein